MSLHGSIEVNGHIIGYYNIRRTVGLKAVNVSHPYEYTVNVNGKTVKGTTIHKYSDGAPELIARVMSKAGYEFRNVSEVPENSQVEP